MGHFSAYFKSAIFELVAEDFPAVQDLTGLRPELPSAMSHGTNLVCKGLKIPGFFAEMVWGIFPPVRLRCEKSVERRSPLL